MGYVHCYFISVMYYEGIFCTRKTKGAILNPNFNIIEDFLIKKPLKGGNSDEFRWRLLIIKN